MGMPAENDFFPSFSAREFEARRSRIRAAMKEQGLDCLIVYGAYSYAGTDTGSVNVVYLANYAAINHSYVVFPAAAEPTLIIGNTNHLANARDIAVIEDVRSGGQDLTAGLGQRLQELGLEKATIGIVGPLPTWWTNTLPVEHHDYIRQLLPQARLRVVTPWFEALRLVKSEEELKLMEKAAALTDQAYEALVQATRPGVRHTDLRRLIESVAGAAGGKFPFSHVSSTSMDHPHQTYPDFYPTHKTVQAGEVVMTELALGYGLYFGKIWAAYFVGEPSAQYRQLFETGARVYDQAIAELKPGMSGRDVNAWMERFRDAGYVAINSAPLVNGWSTYNHAPHFGAITPPSKRAYPSDGDFVLQPGHCVGIRAYPGSGDLKRAVWMGSTCVMTPDGLRNLHRAPVNALRVAA